MSATSWFLIRCIMRLHEGFALEQIHQAVIKGRMVLHFDTRSASAASGRKDQMEELATAADA